jgi:transcriptional regulator with XRE-family HTH domain
VLDVQRWAELRREHFVRGVAIKELARRYGVDRNTVRRALRSDEPPRYHRPAAASKLDPFKEEIHELLRRDPGLSGVRVRELIEPLGYRGGKTIVDDYRGRSARCLSAGECFSARHIARGRSASLTCGTPQKRFRWGTANRGRGMSWSPRWAIHGLGLAH